MHFYTIFTKNKCFEVQKQLKALKHDGDFIDYLYVLNFFRIFAENILIMGRIADELNILESSDDNIDEYSDNDNSSFT